LPGNRYEPCELQVLPVDLDALRAAEQRWSSRSLPTYSMEPEPLFAALLRQYLFVVVFRACAQSLAAENASRLAAMEAAERNLRDRHDELLGEFRRRRQDEITAEILDIVSGYEALQSPDGHTVDI
jgi:F-type H+-transporting ATPase subunit gamma